MAWFAAVAGAAVIAGGCTWVKPDPEAEGVHLGTASETARCKRLGATHTTTRAKVAFFARSQKKIDQELENLARNEAAKMGGDTIVPSGPTSSEGRRSFDVYKCTVP